MSNRFLEGLRSHREELQTTIENITNGAAEERRDLNESELANVRGISEELAPLDERIRQLNGIEEARLGYLDDARRVDGLSHGLRPQVSGLGLTQRSQSWSERFLESGALDHYQGRGRSETIDVGPVFRNRDSGGGGSNGNGDVLTTGDFEDTHLNYHDLGIRELRTPPNMLAVLPTGQTNAGVIQYVQEEEPTYGAAVVPEGEPKPPTKFAFTPKTVTVVTIAHWVAATRQVLDDIPQLRSYIDGRLRFGLLRKVEDFVLNGDATSGDPGLLAEAQSASGGNVWEALLDGAEEITAANYTPNAVVMNQRDWYGFLGELLSTGTGSGSLQDTVITDSLPPRIIGLPVVFSPTVPQGDILIGDFTNGCQLWDRQATQVFVSDSHDDFFIRNTLVILAEARMALAIYAPKAFAVATVGSTGRRGRTAPTPASQPSQSSQPAATARRTTSGGE